MSSLVAKRICVKILLGNLVRSCPTTEPTFISQDVKSPSWRLELFFAVNGLASSRHYNRQDRNRLNRENVTSLIPIDSHAQPSQQTSRLDRLAKELGYAVSRTDRDDLAVALNHVAGDAGAALIRRARGLWELVSRTVGGTVSELEGFLTAYSADRLASHLRDRSGQASTITVATLRNGAKTLLATAESLRKDPASAGPRLFVLVLSSVAASGGVDGDGGLVDLDIPLMGVGAHRSPFTHSIIVGSVLETALLLITRIVLCTHKNLPAGHDPLWEALVGKSMEILSSAGKGASIGIAYHLMIDAVAQPGAFHGLPFDMPLEAHQTLMGANAAAEGIAASAVPPLDKRVQLTPEIEAAHKRHRTAPMQLPEVLRELLTTEQIEILSSYGTWMQALATRTIPPTTDDQVQFLVVADGRRLPTSSHERAWAALIDAKKLAGWMTTTRHA